MKFLRFSQIKLGNKIYYGMIEYNGELYDGKHEPKALSPKKREMNW
ncbi:hypothetical protein KKH19_03975 [Patescibacteria group bacterium]|nr:hypothetical protein [Patescibacteria group bacterium]